MINILLGNNLLETKTIRFSDGAVSVQIKNLPETFQGKLKFDLVVSPKTPVASVREELSLVLDSLDSTFNRDEFEVYLIMPYFPHARADRVFERGMGCPLKSFCQFLTNRKFDAIYVEDVHNLAAVRAFAPDLNIIENTQVQCFAETVNANFKKQWDYVVAPDKGAVEKAKAIAQLLDVPILFMDKERDVTDGRILSMSLQGDAAAIKGKNILIPDDITDGMGTHIWAANILKGEHKANAVDLYVTHAICSRGLKQAEQIDHIFTRNIVGNNVTVEDLQEFNNRNTGVSLHV